jgi:hypothetical protein
MSAWLTHWPWWLGSVVFAVIVLAYWKLMGTPLGASGSYARIADAVSNREDAERELALSDPKALEEALRAATEAEFGAAAVAEDPGSAGDPASPAVSSGLMPWTAHLGFLVAMIAGGAVASLLRGNYAVSFDLGPEHAKIFGSGLGAGFVLVGAGALIGFGTRMGGGCSSGHGLSGCSRLQPGSLIGTAAFFGAAVGVSLLLSWVAK